MLLQEKNGEHLGRVEAENRKEQETQMAEAEELQRPESTPVQKKNSNSFEKVKSAKIKKRKCRIRTNFKKMKRRPVKMQKDNYRPENQETEQGNHRSRSLQRQRRTNPAKILRRNRKPCWQFLIR